MVNFSLRYLSPFARVLIIGTKVWTLISPEYAENLYDLNGLLPKAIDSTEARFKNIEKAREVAITVAQYPGETIFVPSGWHHQVINCGYLPHMFVIFLLLQTNLISPTLSLNHNWFNAACLQRMYDSLCREHTLSTYAIRDLKEGMDAVEFEELVQGLLKENYGMDWNSSWELIEWNVKNRGNEDRMCLEEEERILVGVVEMWLRRDEARLISGVKDRVLGLKLHLVSFQDSI